MFELVNKRNILSRVIKNSQESTENRPTGTLSSPLFIDQYHGAKGQSLPHSPGLLIEQINTLPYCSSYLLIRSVSRLTWHFSTPHYIHRYYNTVLSADLKRISPYLHYHSNIEGTTALSLVLFMYHQVNF